MDSPHALLPQVCQPLLHGLDLELEFRQIGLQLGDLLGLRLVAAVEVMAAAAIAAAAAVARLAAATTAALAVFVLAFTGFVGHRISLSLNSICENSMVAQVFDLRVLANQRFAPQWRKSLTCGFWQIRDLPHSGASL